MANQLIGDIDVYMQNGMTILVIISELCLQNTECYISGMQLWQMGYRDMCNILVQLHHYYLIKSNVNSCKI